MIDSMVRTILSGITIKDILEAINRKYGSSPALRMKNDDGSFRQVSYIKQGRRVVSISSALMNFGVKKGDAIAIFCENRPEWAAAFFGVVSCAGVALPIDVKLSDEEVRFILNDSRAKCIFVSARYIGVIDRLRASLPCLERVILMDKSHRTDVVLLNKLRPHRGQERDRPVYPEDTALMVYTSGTTGVAKGVEISYRNLLFQVLAFSQIIHYSPKDEFLSLLPLNHMLEITGGLIAPLYGGATVTYCDTLKTNTIIPLMRETGTTAVIAVPLILKMIHSGIMKRRLKLSLPKRAVFDLFLAVSRRLLKYNIRAGRFLFRALHREFGVRLRGFISGGAPLDIGVEMDLNAMGFWILQGYGLTETAPVISVNTFKESRFGSVGKPLPGVEVKIINPVRELGGSLTVDADGDLKPPSAFMGIDHRLKSVAFSNGVKQGDADTEGEIITRGPHVMKGYFRNPDKTAEVIRDGWFYTGDLGHFDEDGFLYITGRSKSMIVLGAGKKVFPEEVEAVMGRSPYIKEICVLAKKAERGLRKGCEEVHAVIVPNIEAFVDEKAYSKDEIAKKISSELARLGRELADYKRIADFRLVYEDLPKTVTRKIRRDAVSRMVDPA